MITNSKFLTWQVTIVNLDFLYKINAKNNFLLPNIQSLFLHTNYNINDLDSIIQSYVNLYLVTNQKPIMIKCIKPQLKQNLKKGSAIGIKIKLQKKSCLRFLEMFVLFQQQNNNLLLLFNKTMNNQINLQFKNIHVSSYSMLKTSFVLNKLNSSLTFKDKNISTMICFLTAFQIN